MNRYRIVLHEDAARELPTSTVAKQRVFGILLFFAENPFERGHRQSRDRDGRPIEISHKGKLEVRWYADHAVSEIRVLSISKIEA